ncbi:hypothetical protein [Ruminococcus flavefaciens]|uniref:Lipoprotein n=1 Tax=Ruminococcus flavefaciens 007c TaxID=1341157 RepID=W7UK40_RUMFL|nr:hypothetical protein [Ruminococcus flavefaciens]EWM54123.1 hypothetical protein RF007C_01235 [Ruminococcus flavefaciens 007c]
MKKQNKIILLSILSCLIAFITSCSFTHNTKIKTKFGDEFIVSSDSWTDSYYIKDVNSDFGLSISYFEDENDFKPICDTKLFRCYRLKNSIDDIYICKLKNETSFFWIGADVNEPPSFFKDKYGEQLKSHYLADIYIMEICTEYLYKIYHEEFIEMAEKIKEKDYEYLKKYGLTLKMIENTDEFKQKEELIAKYVDEP